MRQILSLIVAVLLIGTGYAQQLKIDATQAKVAFYFHGDKVDGTLSGFEGTIKFDPSTPSSAEISGSVKAGTINTGNKMRDKHLASSDFFHAEKFPEIRFRAAEVKKEGESYTVRGKLTIKDTPREELFKMSVKEGKLIFTSTINSADYGIMEKKKREDSQVDITIEIPLL